MMEMTQMKHTNAFAALAILCLLAGSAYAVSLLVPASVDENRCSGCGACVDSCPESAISMNADGIAEVDPEKCTGCGRCTRACPFEAISGPEK